MAAVDRRTFYAKVGQAAPLVQHFQEAEAQMKGYGIGWETRIYTDYYKRKVGPRGRGMGLRGPRRHGCGIEPGNGNP